jgi:hypothetical protein
VFEHAGVDVERGELVLAGLRFGVGERVDQRRLADAGEPHQRNGRIAGLLDGVAVAAAGGGLVLQLLLLLREFRLQAPDVALRGLVVGRLGDLLAEFLDLLLESHRSKIRRGRR